MDLKINKNQKIEDIEVRKADDDSFILNIGIESSAPTRRESLSRYERKTLTYQNNEQEKLLDYIRELFKMKISKKS